MSLVSTCPSCKGGQFELKVIEPHDSRFKVSAVQCRSCGVVVGVMDYLNIGTAIQGLEKTMGELKSRVDSIASSVQQVAHVLSTRR